MSIFWDGPRIHVAQPKDSSIAEFWEMTDIPSVYIIIITVSDYLAVASVSAPGNWVVVPGYIQDPPKTQTRLHLPISNNLGPQ